MSKKKNKHRDKQSSNTTREVAGTQGTAVAQPPSRRTRPTEVKMVTHLNSRFLIILASIVALLGVGTYFLHGFQVKRNSQVLADNAELSLEAGDTEKAIVLYSQYIRLAPEDHDALARLGELIDQSPPTFSSRNRAYKLYSELIREAPNREDAPQIRFRLVQLMMSLGEYSQAEKQLAKLFQLPELPDEVDTGTTNDDQGLKFDRAELLDLQAQCEAAQDQPQDALASTLSALISQPQRAEYYERAINLAQSLGKEIPDRDQMLDLLKTEPRQMTAIPEELLEKFPSEPPAETEDPQANGDSETAESSPTEEEVPHPVTVAETLVTDAQPLISYLLQQISTQVNPEFEGQIARARYFLDRGDLEGVEAELEKISDDDRNQADVTLFQSRYALLQAERLMQQDKSEAALTAIQTAEQIANTGKQQDPFDLRYDLLLANAGFLRFLYEPQAETKKSALQESITVIENGIDSLPDSREGYLKIADLEERFRKLMLVSVLEVELRTQLVKEELTKLESDLFDETQVPADRSFEKKVEGHIKQLAELTRDKGLLTFLKAQQKYAQLQRQILRGPTAADLSSLSWGAVADALRGARLQVHDRPSFRRPIDLMLNQCYKELNNDEARVALFREVYEQDTNWGSGRLEYARALRDSGRLQEANRQFAVISQQLNMTEALPEIIQSQIALQQTLSPEQQDWKAVAQNVAQLRASDPNAVGLRLMEVEVKAQQGQFEAAQQLLDETLELPKLTRADQIALWQSRIELQLQRDDQSDAQKLAAAEELLTKARESLGNCAQLAIKELRIAEQRSDDVLADKADRLGQSIKTYPKDEQIEFLEYLAAVYNDLESTEKELNTRQQLVALRPDSLSYQLGVARLASQQDDGRLFHATLQAIRNIEGADGPEGNLQQASWHITKYERTQELAQYQAAFELLEELSQDRPRWARVPLAQGYLEGLKDPDGLNDEVQNRKFGFYRQAIDLGATSPQILNQYHNYLIQQGRESEEKALLSKANQKFPGAVTPQMRQREQQLSYFEDEIEVWESKLYAKFDLSEKDQWSSAEKAEYELAQATAKYVKHRNQTLFNKKVDPDLLVAAKRHLQNARDLGPQFPQVWTDSVTFLVAIGEEEQAKRMTQEAAESLPAEPPELKPLTLGKCYRSLGETELAREQYDLAVQAASENEQVLATAAAFAESIDDRETAEKLLNRISKLTQADAPAIAAQADARLKYLSFLKSKTYSQALKSIQSLEVALPSNRTARLQNLATQVEILQRFPVYDFQEKLAKVLEQMQELRRLPIATQLIQITLYKTLGQDDVAEQKLLEILKAAEEQDELLIRSYATEYFVNRGMIQQSREQLELLKSELPDSYLVMALEAKLADADDDSQTKPADIVQTYLNELSEAQSANRIFLDSISRHDPRKAFNWLVASKIAEHDPDVRNRITEATTRLLNGNLENARIILAPLLKRNDVQKLVYATRIRQCAGLLDGFGALPEAEQIYRDRYLPVTDEENAPVQLISLLARQDKVEDAIRQGESILNDKNAALIAANLLAILRTAEVTDEQQQRVKAVLDRAVAVAPEDVLPMNLLGDYLDFTQDYVAAEQTYLQILARNPRHPVALNNLAWMFAMREPNAMRLDRATKMIDQVIDVFGPTPELLDTKATVEMSAGRFEASIVLLQKSIALSPSDKKYYRLSLAQLKAGQKDAARKSYRKLSKEFTPEKLHPLERSAFEMLKSDLVVRK